jgi:hypothetical protein
MSCFFLKKKIAPPIPGLSTPGASPPPPPTPAPRPPPPCMATLLRPAGPTAGSASGAQVAGGSGAGSGPSTWSVPIIHFKYFNWKKKTRELYQTHSMIPAMHIQPVIPTNEFTLEIDWPKIVFFSPCSDDAGIAAVSLTRDFVIAGTDAGLVQIWRRGSLQRVAAVAAHAGVVFRVRAGWVRRPLQFNIFCLLT